MKRNDPIPIKIEKPGSTANAIEPSQILQDIYDKIEKIPTQLEVLDKIKNKINQLQDTIDSKLTNLISSNEKIAHTETKLDILINLNENIVQKLENLVQISEKIFKKLDQQI